MQKLRCKHGVRIVGAWTEAKEQVLKTNFGSVARKELLRLLPGRTYRGITSANDLQESQSSQRERYTSQSEDAQFFYRYAGSFCRSTAPHL